ncbi:hypothetical protein Ctob_001943 [Chrysochromulina tobinii]|uniref:Exostosin GT47 domain-containing protein n=1 Tax=Chrysochromulina tobinii TaxID=1460289 RepID=A0A0M0JPN4_9EUKA|nr:hypothetical protein Ctob_001943 [Chrysochromulina tobinii]|eukprot:KOO28450.1 hypothetical protein Ctob_001943 [Chrysochromulina sp. CCMP291]
MLRLLAPSLLPSWARDALILDPLSLVMLPPSRLMRHMRTEHVRTEAHTAQAGAGSRCVLGVADWRALAVAPDQPRFDTAVLYMDLICARENGWLGAAGSATRRVLGSAPDSDARVKATSHPDCPSALLDEASQRRPAHAPRSVTAEPSLGCEWSYEAMAHAALGQHHRLVTLPSEGLSSVYIVCARDLMHQAFARAWERAHAHVYEGRSFLGSTDKSDRAKRIALVDGALDLLSVRSVRGGGVDDDEEEATVPARVFHRRGNVACYGSACDDEAYVRATLDSALCLQLPGSSVESNRLYEGLEGGCIPVVVLRFGPGEAAVGTVPTYDADAIEAVNAAFAPLRNVTGEPPPFVFVTHESELSARLAALAWSAERLDEQQALTMAWWRDAKRYYARAFTRWACPKPREGLKAEL